MKTLNNPVVLKWLSDAEDKAGKPSCLDAAYERQAVIQGLNKNPVFPENKKFLKEINENG